MNSIPLSPIDYIFTGAGSQPVTFGFYYPEKQDAAKLKESLDEALKNFTVLKSRLQQISEKEFEFEICDDGLTFEVRHIDSEFDKNDNIKKYIAPVKTVEGKPLAKISLTYTPNGSVLAVSISHALADGFSYFHFLSSWAKINKNERFIPPHIDRNIFSEMIHNKDKQITKEDLLNNCGLYYNGKREDVKDGAYDRLFISSDTIELISKIGREKDLFLTENDIITGMTWKKYLVDWMKDSPDTLTYLTFPFDFRRAVEGFPKNYFGCAICFGVAELSLKDLAGSPEEEVALVVKKSVAKVKSDYIKNSINTLENFRNQKDTEEFEKLHLRHPECGIIITNISRLPVCDLDFGKGAPTDVLTYAEVLRSAAILPADGGVEIQAMSSSIY